MNVWNDLTDTERVAPNKLEKLQSLSKVHTDSLIISHWAQEPLSTS